MTLWYIDRATAIVALVLFSVVVLLGVWVRLRVRLPGLPRFGTVALHRSVSLLAAAFLGTHIATVVLDSHVSVGVLDVVVPFTAGYQPLWVGLGTVAADLLLAVLVTSLLRPRIGLRTWRAVHWFGYACWPVAMAHSLGVGTDTGSGVALWITVASALLVAAAVVLHLTHPSARRQRAADLLAAPHASRIGE
ncbi:ferric reductase-like transmembrane domain-containing protein [Streptomyces sp. NPDC002730]|uniref:ferric reductase-like transmembrane domain-containing protein n=1 Tax=Streptomyces sp. NPDC002730 TaxID=3364662 RepID=UPI0036B5A172